jgi:hypothetical protein
MNDERRTSGPGASCAEFETQIAAALAGEVSAAERRELDEHLARCPRCAREAADLAALWRGLERLPADQPSPFLAARFERMLRREIELDAQGSQRAGAAAGGRRFGAATLAAALAVGIGIGVLFRWFGAPSGEIEALRDEVGSLHQMVAVSLLAQASPSERLQGVAYGRQLAGQEPRVLEALFSALATDPNVNVRLAALEALAPATELPARRHRLVQAVAAQDSPLVQLTAIDLLLEGGGEAARRDLESLLADPDLDPTVASYLRDRLGRSA